LVAALAAWWLAAAQVPSKFGVIGVLIVVPVVGLAVGWLNGLIITKGRLQPFIVTLAMMVGVLGIARVVAGQDAAVHPVYTGTNATEDFDILRSLLYRIVPVPGLFFLAVVVLSATLLRATTFGRYVYAIGGNEQAARLSGVEVDRVKIAAYAISGFLASLAGVLYTAQYRQGKPDAGVGMELDAIAAVVIGGTSLMGGKGSIAGTFVGVLIFGFLSNILQLNNIDSNTQLVLKGGIILAAVLVQERSLGDLFSLKYLFSRRSDLPIATEAHYDFSPQQTGTSASATERRLADHP
jgi:simple sugar transport system permease protein